MCERPVEGWTLALNYVPHKCNTQEMFNKAVKKNICWWNLFLIITCPNGCMKKLLEESWMHWNLFLISIRPNRYVMKLLKDGYPDSNLSSVISRTIHDNLKNQELCERAVLENPYVLAYVLDQCKTQEICQKLLIGHYLHWRFFLTGLWSKS